MALEAYREFASKAFAREAAYPFEVFTNLGSILLRVYLLRQLWTALYAHNIAPAGISLHAMITYATVSLLMSLILEIDGSRLIRDRLREGTIATDLMKPISLPLYFFSDGLGRTLFAALLIVPSALLALLLVHVDVPDAATVLTFAAAFLLAYLLNYCINFIMNGVAFWTLETHAIQLMVRWASDLLGGQVLPLAFFPGILGQVVGALPFAAVYSIPLRIYIGDLPPAQSAAALGVQALWIAIFGGLAAIMWHFAERRIVVQGG